MTGVKGRISSVQTFGTLDGPGVRFVLFMQGCNLRCGCCHNPETWEQSGGEEYAASDMMKKILRYRVYFGEKGGVTLSGGEPLLQSEFAKELFVLCHENGINTCLDTSGSIINNEVKELLLHCDRVLLDIKYTDEEMYKKYVGCSYKQPVEFLDLLDEMAVPTTVRQVIIPTLNDNEQNIIKLSELINSHKCVDAAELLPFKKLCKTKYESCGLEFKFDSFAEPSSNDIEMLYKRLKNSCSAI